MKTVSQKPFSLLVTAISLFAFTTPVLCQASDGGRESQIGKHLWARRGSLRRVLLSAAGTNLRAELSIGHPQCGTAVRRLYMEGQSLYSKTIDKSAFPLSTIQFPSGVQDDLFYHTTINEDFMNMLDLGDAKPSDAAVFEKIFTHLHTRATNARTFGNWLRMFYVAEDKNDTVLADFAPYKVEFKFKMDSRMTTIDSSLWTAALKEIESKYPQIIQACGKNFDFRVGDHYATVYYHALTFLIAEDSGIDIMDYHQKNHWFQVITPDVMLSSSAIGRTGVGSGTHHHNVGDDNQKNEMESLIDSPAIHVISASFGDSDVLTAVQDFADGKITAQYRVRSKYLGTLNSGQKDSFQVTWECLKGGLKAHKVGSAHSISFEDHAQGSQFEMSCEP